MYDKSKITIIIPTKDEGQGIQKILQSVKPYANEIIVVDGHSKDNTKEIVSKFGAKFILDNKLGRGDGVRIGIKAAKNDIIVFFDADGSHEAKDIPRLIAPILKKQADMVIASRRTGGSFDLNMNFAGVLRSAGADLLATLVNHRYKTRLSDVLYSFRAMRKSAANSINLTSNDFCIEQEMVVKSLKKGHKIVEIPSREKARGWGSSKLSTIAGIKFVFVLLRDMYL